MRQRIAFGNIVRVLIKRGYTTKRLGAEIGLTQPSVSRLATGVTTSVNAEAAIRLIELVGGEVTIPALPTEEASGDASLGEVEAIPPGARAADVVQPNLDA